MPATARADRHRAILEIVRIGEIRNQADLADRLAELGHEVDQATISRDLRTLGVAKGPDGYLPPSDAPVDPLIRAVREWLDTATAVAHQIVLRTPPSGAQPLALALDAAGRSDVIGTIAGDDTVLVICPHPRAATALRDELLGLTRR